MKSYMLTIFLLLTLLMINSCKKEEVGLNYTIDDVFVNAGQNENLRCLIVYKDDHILKEKYFHPGDSSSTLDVRSVTKSVMSTLIGIAIEKGYIPSENQTIGDYLRPFDSKIDSVKANIKICDLLSMSSGISGNDLIDGSGYNNWENASNQIEYSLNSPMVSTPGKIFAYNNGASHLVSAVLTQATGMTTYQFAEKYLFQPLGISNHYWLTDNQGIYKGAEGLYLTPYDMLKLGKLYLNKGIYDGLNVVSEEWIEKSTVAKIATDVNTEFAPNYGYFWWIGGVHSHRLYFANGFGGQFIVVIPDLYLIIVATNNWSGVSYTIANQQWYSTLDMIINKIIPLYE